MQRRLTTILAADVAGYSRLAGTDEEGTLGRLKALRHELIDPAIATARGRVVKTMGDGILIEFPSVVDAVRCAIEVQRGMGSRNAGLGPEQRIEFRVGFHLGDVVVQGDDLLGDGVNIAARLEGISETGGIALSEDAFRQVHGKIAAEFVDLGEQTLKNIARPVRVYRIAAGGQSAAQPTTSALALPDRPSIAVLAFQNMSGDAGQEYFCDGMVEDLITGLARIKWLFVIARNSSFTYKGKAVDVKQVGRDLGVRYVLEGSVRKAGNRVRITGQLIEAATGLHIWAERYDRDLTDIFVLQDDIAMSVIGAIEPSLRRAEIERAKRKRPDSLDAYDLYLRALPFASVLMPQEAEKAFALLHQAVILDPDFAAAHAMLAVQYGSRFMRGSRRQEDLAASLHHARAALATAGDDASALGLAGLVLAIVDRDFATALPAVNRALALGHSSATVQGYAALVNAWMGNGAAAIEQAGQALRMSPLDPQSFMPYHALAIGHFLEGQFAEAAEAATKAAESNPRFDIAYLWRAAALARLGRIDEARGAWRQLLDVNRNFVESWWKAGGAGTPELMAALTAALRLSGLPE